MQVACIAQAIVESGRGSSRVATECLNFWGMKMRDELAAIAVGTEVKVNSERDGYAVFAKFPSADIAVSGWLIFLSRPYYAGWESYKDNCTLFLRHICRNWSPRGGYADDVIAKISEAKDLLGIESLPDSKPIFGSLMLGSTGTDVERLQSELNSHYDARLQVDGIFGVETDRAVRRVESIQGTESNGIVDADFWNLLLTLQGLKIDITPETSRNSQYMPFAVRMTEIPTLWTYEGKWPIGAILHFTAGRDNPRATVEYLGRMRYPCLVMGRDGVVYQAFPASRGGHHCGTVHHDFSVGLEVISAGRCTPVDIDGKALYAPWFAYKDGDPRTGVIKTVSDCLDSSEMRHVSQDGSRYEGWYQKYTAAQEESIIRVFLWYKWADPTGRFEFKNILGHDEACDLSGFHGAKNDPGGALSMTMPLFRKLLSERWAQLMAKSEAEQFAYFAP